MRIPGQLSRMAKSEEVWLPIYFNMKKDSSGTRINDIETHHIATAKELVEEVTNGNTKLVRYRIR
jgi:hypothetical protein